VPKSIYDVAQALKSNSRKAVRALNIEWIPSGSGGYVIDYGWAILAKRTPKTITIYNGWWGYSRTTSKHLSQIHPGSVRGVRVITSRNSPSIGARHHAGPRRRGQNLWF